MSRNKTGLLTITDKFIHFLGWFVFWKQSGRITYKIILNLKTKRYQKQSSENYSQLRILHLDYANCLPSPNPGNKIKWN